MAQTVSKTPGLTPGLTDGLAIETAPSRGTLGGISAVVAVALAISAVLGTWTAGVMQADRMSDGLVARYVTAAIVRSVDRARVREDDVPAMASGARCGRDEIEAAGREARPQVFGSVGLNLLGLGEIDLPPPMMA